MKISERLNMPSDVELLLYLLSPVGAWTKPDLARAAIAGFRGDKKVFRVFTGPTPPPPMGFLVPAVVGLHPFASRWGLPNPGHQRVHGPALWLLNQTPRVLPALNRKMNPIAKSNGVFNEIEPPHNVAIQLNWVKLSEKVRVRPFLTQVPTEPCKIVTHHTALQHVHFHV